MTSAGRSRPQSTVHRRSTGRASFVATAAQPGRISSAPRGPSRPDGDAPRRVDLAREEAFMKAGLALAIFAFAYVLIAARRLPFLPIGRAFGAMLGAVLLVLTGCLTPEAAYASVDGNTIAILFGMMVLQVELDRCGLLDAVTASIAKREWSATRLLVAVLTGSGLLSALLVNDAVCLMATPLVARLCRGGLSCSCSATAIRAPRTRSGINWR